MQIKILSLLAAVGVLFSPAPSFAAEAKSPKTALQELVAKIQVKIKEGKKAASDYTAELAEFDALLAEHKTEKTYDVAQILMMKALLYIQLFKDTDKGIALLQQLKAEFPETDQGKRADETITSIKKGEESKKLQSSLVAGAKFPDFNEKDLAGKPMSIANLKGKVVLVDFWATWCGPCVAELPNVLSAYEKHHADGFEVLGISLDQDQAKVEAFTQSKKMTWQQFFDGKGWGNKLAAQYGIQSIPATYLLDGEGKIIATDL